MIILGIDTSCDDTSIAIIDERTILANIINSQDDVHQEFGGVVPILAKRAHETNFEPVLQSALHTAQITPKDIDLIAVTLGPGLAPSLEVGVTKAQQLAKSWQKPVEAIHHMEGHLAACFGSLASATGLDPKEVHFPALAILASGGHTEIVLIQSWGKYEILGETVDDAIGEAYDKVARLIGLGFPGGAQLAALAQIGNPHAYPLPIAMRQSGNFNVSYSGIKTATLKLVRHLTDNDQKTLTKQQQQDIAASFEEAALQTLLQKIEKVLLKYPVKNVLLGGGVAANPKLRQELENILSKTQSLLSMPVDRSLCQDNGAMIALAAWLHQTFHYSLEINSENLDRRPQWRLDTFSQETHK